MKQTMNEHNPGRNRNRIARANSGRGLPLPAYNPGASQAVVFQLQLDIAW